MKQKSAFFCVLRSNNHKKLALIGKILKKKSAIRNRASRLEACVVHWPSFPPSRAHVFRWRSRKALWKCRVIRIRAGECFASQMCRQIVTQLRFLAAYPWSVWNVSSRVLSCNDRGENWINIEATPDSSKCVFWPLPVLSLAQFDIRLRFFFAGSRSTLNGSFFWVFVFVSDTGPWGGSGQKARGSRRVLTTLLPRLANNFVIEERLPSVHVCGPSVFFSGLEFVIVWLVFFCIFCLHFTLCSVFRSCDW